MNYVTFSNELRDTDNVETQVKQRCTKKILKFTQKHRYKQRETEFLVNLVIPRTIRLKQYFRANYDIQLCFDTYNENTLGELSTNIFSIGYACSQAEIHQDKLRFLFSERDLQNISIEEACNILETMNMQKAKENILNFVNYHQNTLNINWSTLEEIKTIENYALQYPYECYIYRFHSNGSNIVQYQLNEKYLQLMGITKEMYLKFESETKTLPCAIKVVSYIDVWNEVFGAVSQGLSEYQMELQNYNGQKSYVKIEQKKIFLICPHDHQQYCLVYWIYKTETSSELAQKNYQDLLDQLNPKPKQCTYRLKEL